MTVSIQSNGTYGSLLVNGAEEMRFGADNSGQLAGFRNLLINGDMRVKQQPDYVNTLAAVTAQYCGADRWFVVNSITASLSVTRQITSLQGTAFGLRVQRAPGVTAATTLTVAQQIESNNLYQVQGKKVTFSFKARCGANFSPTNSQFLAILAFGTTSDQAAIGGVNGAWAGWSQVPAAFSASTSWAYYTATFDVPASTQEMQVKFSWETVGTAGAEDWLQITDVQVEEGSIATPFERRPVGLELLLCQRYYQLVQARDSVWINSSDFYDRGWNRFVCEMRRNPDCIFYAMNSGTPNCVRNLSASTDVPLGAGVANTQGIQSVTTTGGTATQLASWYMRASAEF